MAFISELHFNTQIRPPYEYVEIALAPGENPADYTISFYYEDGRIDPPSLDFNPGAVFAEGELPELTLSDGRFEVNADPDHPDWTIYTIRSALDHDHGHPGGLLHGGEGANAHEASHVALTNNATGEVISAYAIGRSPERTLSGGAADGVTSTSTGPVGSGNQSHQWDAGGNRANGAITENDAFICFASGTLIRTSAGDIPIEEITAGDLVLTRDSGFKPVQWIGGRKLSAEILSKLPKLRPIRIAAGALGNGLPMRELVVSPQHRVLVRSKIARNMFCTDEVLVAAKHMLDHDGIEIADDLVEVEYFHFLLDRHEVVISNGAETESLYTGPQTLESVGDAARDEIFTIFPELRNNDPEERPKSARLLLTGRQGRKLMYRHAKNNRLLVSAPATGG